MPPISPIDLLELLKATRNGTGLPTNADKVTATASPFLNQLVKVVRDEGGALRVRLKKNH